jgi:hypothetical protein
MENKRMGISSKQNKVKKIKNNIHLLGAFLE